MYSGYIVLTVCLGLAEIVRLLKSKGIHMQSGDSSTSAEEATKRRLYAKYERRKQRQLEHNVLRKEMASHPLPQLFVSRRSDRNPNGFNCAVCRRDVSFLTRGEPEIWRHFTSKSHFVKDRRYRLDHEEVLYTTRFDEVPVSAITPELRAEIEKTPAVVLGKKNPFVEDEVDALVGVVSNVPSSTLVGGLFELLRSGGSHRFLRRLWSQFQAALPVGSSCAQATWSKTETLVIIGQTLYPRILRRVQGWVKDAFFSVSLQEVQSGLRFCVHCFSDGLLREVCVLCEPVLPGLCDAEIVGLSRIFAILPAGQSPVCLRGFPSTLFNVTTEWCVSQGCPKPMFVAENTPKVFKEHVQEAGKLGSSALDCFALLEYLLLRLSRAVDQPWMLRLTRMRRCIRQRDIPFASLSVVLEELVSHWEDVKLFLGEGVVVPTSRSKIPQDLSQMVLADDYILPRLCVLQVLVLCFSANFEKQFVSKVTDYSCRNYSEFCFFYWSVLSKVKKLSELPEIDAWSEYVGKPLTTWSNIPYVECLVGEPIVMKVLSGCTVAVRRSFLRESQSMLMAFLRVLNESRFMRSRLSSSLSCFSPDMLLLGDESYAVELFRDLVAVYQECGRLTAVEAEGACNEFKSFLVELRRRNRRVVSTITDAFSFMRESDAFNCRDHLSRVVRLSSVLVVPRETTYPDVDISLSGIAVPSKILTSAILSVQSYVSFSGFSSGELLTKDCLDDLKANLPAGKTFIENAAFSPWTSVYLHSHRELYRGLRDRFDSYFLEQVDDWRHRLGTLSKLSVAGTGGSSVSPSADAVVAVPQASSSVSRDADKVKNAPHGTPPSASAVTVDKSLLICSPVRSSDVTRVLQQRRQERKEMSSSGQTSSNVSKGKKKSSKRR